MGSLGWPAWILLSFLALSGFLALALHIFRIRYSLAYAFPAPFEARLEIVFLGWRKVLARREAGDRDDGHAGPGTDDPGPAATPAGETASPGPGYAGPGPAPGQEGFLAMPVRDGLIRMRARLRSAALKWALDVPVWRHLAAYLLRSGRRTLRFIGPSLDHLHVGSADVLNLGRFAAAWSSLCAVLPFLACPVEYGFNERPFSFRFRLSGGCTALGLLAFILALFLTLPWRRLAARFLSCWRNPRLAHWQARLVAAAT